MMKNIMHHQMILMNLCYTLTDNMHLYINPRSLTGVRVDFAHTCSDGYSTLNKISGGVFSDSWQSRKFGLYQIPSYLLTTTFRIFSPDISVT